MRIALLCGGLLLATAVAVAQERPPLAAQTMDGDKVLLHPSGRWEYVDAAKAEAARRVAAEFPENRTRPIDSQGLFVGSGGRLILPGDKDYNRGSLNPKLR